MPNPTKTSELNEVQRNLSLELILLSEHDQLKVLKAALVLAQELTKLKPEQRHAASFELTAIAP